MHDPGSNHSGRVEPVIRPATRADLEQFYDGHVPVSMRAHVLELDGRVLGIGGLYDDNGYVIAFSVMRDELRAHRRWIAKGVRYLQRVIEQEPGKVLALASPVEKTSRGLLAKMGFEYVRDTELGALCAFRRI